MYILISDLVQGDPDYGLRPVAHPFVAIGVHVILLGGLLREANCQRVGREKERLVLQYLAWQNESVE